MDISETALKHAQENATLNDISPDLYRTQKADVFDFLKEAHQEKLKTDLIVLDPPSFLKSRSAQQGASRGFKELNLRALHCLRPGGLLVSCVCSQNMDSGSYREVLRSASHDARREVRVLEQTSAAVDHAGLTHFPESNYLQAWYLWVQ